MVYPGESLSSAKVDLQILSTIVSIEGVNTHLVYMVICLPPLSSSKDGDHLHVIGNRYGSNAVVRSDVVRRAAARRRRVGNSR